MAENNVHCAAASTEETVLTPSLEGALEPGLSCQSRSRMQKKACKNMYKIYILQRVSLENQINLEHWRAELGSIGNHG